MEAIDYIFCMAIASVLFKIALSDVRRRVVAHQDLAILAGMLLCSWLWHANSAILVYSAAILCVGFALHVVKVLGAGDTKLLAVLSLGVMPEFLPFMLYGTAILGGVLALGYLVYGLLTDLHSVRKKGIPYAVPITISGGGAIFLSYISRLHNV